MPPSATGPNHKHRSSAFLTEGFRKYFEEQRCEGITGGAIESSNFAYYLPQNALEAYFTVERVKRIQSQLSQHRDGSNDPPLHDATHICEKYRKVLAILLFIGRGWLLRKFLSKPNFDDTHLPFADPAKFPSNNKEDFRLFTESQWMFHNPPLEYHGFVNYETQEILPIKPIRKLGEGHNGKAHLVEVHAHHNKLEPSLEPNAHASQSIRPHAHIYVIKTFRPRARQWLAEARSHVMIRTSPVLRGDEGIIGFHGCFSHGDTFGILLEYAPNGNLEQMFQTLGPTSYIDVLDIWNSYFALLRTLKYLRSIEHSGGGRTQMIHFDIKPNNILVLPGDSERPFNFRFKLGDLGSSAYCTLIDEGPTQSMYMRQKQGTRTYGAPECDRTEPNAPLLAPPGYVQPGADLWSYGCVASELATWVLRGRGGLAAYREGRADHQNTTFVDKDCFHNGYQTLPWIHIHHQRLIDSTADAHCNATIPAIQLIEEKMLQFKPEDRAHPKALMHETAGLMHDVEMNIATHESNLSPAQSSLSVRPEPVPSTVRRTEPPQVPPARREDVFHGVSQRPVVVHQRPVQPNPVERSAVTGEAMQSFGLVPLQNDRHDSNISPAEVEARASSQHEMQRNRVDSGASLPDLAHFNTAQPSDFLHQQSPFTEAGADDSDHPRAVYGTSDMIGEAAKRVLEASGPSGHHPRTQVNRLTVESALVWRDRTKSQNLWDRLRKREDKIHLDYLLQLEQDFHNRDFKILVDDSISMIPHWDKVAMCAAFIAFCARRYDKDGMDLSFMFSGRESNSKDDDWVLKQVHQKKPQWPEPGSKHKNQRGNINEALHRILWEYQKKVRHHCRAGMYHQELKRLVLFVLTDGLWGVHSDAKRPLVTLEKTLREHNLPQNQVGVQFIGFGEDVDGWRRLLELDDFLKEPAMDIVDVAPWDNGNVWKMLLGSVNKDFDFSDTACVSEGSHSPIGRGASTPSHRGSGSISEPLSPQSSDQRQRISDPFNHSFGTPTRGESSSQVYYPHRQASHSSQPPSS